MSTADIDKRAASLLPTEHAGPRSASWTDFFLERLGPKEIRRRIWHMSPGLLTVILWMVPHSDPMSPTLRMTIMLVAIGCGLGIFLKYRRIQRAEDLGRLTSVFGYAGCVMATVMLFPADLEIGLAVLAILAFGDGGATLGGKLLRGPRLPWNRDKTWSGLLSFLAIGIPAATLVYWRETHNLEAVGPGVTLLTALIIAGTATAVAAVLESIRSNVNDNIRVGLASAIVLVLMHGQFVGWH